MQKTLHVSVKGAIESVERVETLLRNLLVGFKRPNSMAVNEGSNRELTLSLTDEETAITGLKRNIDSVLQNTTCTYQVTVHPYNVLFEAPKDAERAGSIA